MAGIYDIFRMAAKGVERTPWNWRIMAGTAIGGISGAFSDNEELSFGEKVGKGMFIGAASGLGVGLALRGAGVVAGAGERIGRAAIVGKAAAVRSEGIKALMKPGTLMFAGAAVGAALAPPGSRTQGAMIGAGLGLAAKPLSKTYKGFEKLGRVPGAQSAAMIAAAAVPLAAVAAFGKGTPEGGGAAVFGQGGMMDYQPLSGDMQDRMLAMNASGDIVLGLHGRQHG